MLEDSGLRLRRTKNKSEWVRDVAARRARFQTLIDGLRQDDVSGLNRAWTVGTVNEFYNCTGGRTPTTSDHQKDFIRRFHAFGLRRFDAARRPWLGHTNLAQTSTYLHAHGMGSQECMRRFDAARDQPSTAKTSENRSKLSSNHLRGNLVANEKSIEHPRDSHAEDESTVRTCYTDTYSLTSARSSADRAPAS
jgi:hypothetical protein